MKTRNKIYISGKVSGTDDYIQRFAECEKKLSSDFEVFNPVRYCQNKFFHPENQSWNVLMDRVLYELWYGNFTHIYMMKGWEDSSGAIVEHEYAKKLNLKIIYEVK